MDTPAAKRYANEFEQLVSEFMRKMQSRTWPKDEPPRSQFFLMKLLEHHGPARTADLAAAMGVTSPAVTGLVNELVKSGHAQRLENPDDRRVTLIELTPAGRSALERVRARHRARGVEVLRHFDDAEIDGFLQTLSKLLELIPHADE